MTGYVSGDIARRLNVSRLSELMVNGDGFLTFSLLNHLWMKFLLRSIPAHSSPPGLKKDVELYLFFLHSLACIKHDNYQAELDQ